MKPSQEDEVEDVPIPLDRDTITRLVRFSRDVGQHPRDVAGALLRDLLKEDEEAHLPADRLN